jgi:hypothetical protein
MTGFDFGFPGSKKEVEMDRGMLWFDNNPKTDFKVKIKEAATYYRRKYGLSPNLCLVHPSVLNSEIVSDDKIKIRPNRSVLPGHLWIGINENS